MIAAATTATPDWALVILTAAGFLVGSVWAPWHKDSKETRAKAEKLAIESAIRNEQVDNRLASLLTVTERHERAINRLENRKRDRQ